MFGKFAATWLPVIVLVGFFAYIISLFVNGTINLYVHPRYTIFSVAMAAIGLIVLLLGAGFLRKPGLSRRSKIVDTIAVAVLVLAFVLPAQALSTQTTGRKSLITPTTDTAAELRDDQMCPDQTSFTKVSTTVNTLSLLPEYCFNDTTVEVVGMVPDASRNPLPDGYFYVSRVVLACCAVDATPYALVVRATDFDIPPTDAWVEVSGRLEQESINGQQQFVVVPSRIQPVDEPSEPYEFL